MDLKIKGEIALVTVGGSGIGKEVARFLGRVGVKVLLSEEESPYNACKAAIVNLSKCLSSTYSEENILFNCISPAHIETPMTDAMMEQLAEERVSSVAEAVDWFVRNKRPKFAVESRGKPEEVASVVTFLCSEHASYLNGTNIRVDGGAVESAF